MNRPEPPARVHDVPCPLCGSRSFDTFLHSAAQMTSRHEPFRFTRCRHCNLVYLNPRPTEEDIGLFYGADYPPHRGPDAWGRFASLVRLSQHRLDQQRVRTTARFVDLTHPLRALDVGCGRPSFLLRLQRACRAECVGIDLSDEGWRTAPDEFRPLTLLRGTVQNVELEPTFDVITMWHSIEHEAEPVVALQRLRSFANDSTILVIETPNFDSLTRRAHGSRWAGFHTPRHMAVYTPSTLTLLLETTGWRVTHLQTWATLDAHLLWWLGRKDAQGLLQGGNLEGLFLPFVASKVASWPIRWVERAVSLGLMLAVARPQ